jgi:tetratricopeptide (TPR) repeat protein
MNQFTALRDLLFKRFDIHASSARGSLSEAKANGMREKLISALGGALLLLALLAAYSNHFHNSFHRDDGHTIINNASIRELRNIPLFFRDATTFSTLPSNQSYRPLVSTLLAIAYQLAHGLQPFWFHLSIFALFIALTLLLAFVIHRLLERDSASSSNRWIALAAAACYALNPANADTINYVIASADLISALGVIASFAFYFAIPRLRRYYLYVLPAAIAILAKPPAAIFPVLFAAFRLCFPDPAVAGRRRPARAKGKRRAETQGRRRAGARFVELVPPFVICGAVVLFVQHMTPPTWIGGATDAESYLITQPYVALLYFKTFLWPTGLSADYDLHPFVTTGDPRLWIGFAFVFFISAAAIVAAVSKTRLIGFGLLWFLIALLPTSLFPLAEVMNDHRPFLPYIGLVIAIAGAAALLVARVDRQRSWRKLAAACAVTLFLCTNAYATFQRNKVWETEETLWHDVVLKSPRNGIGLTAYGMTLVNKGDYAGALDYLHRAQQIMPEYPELLINLAIAESLTKQDAAAEQHFKDALRLGPSFPDSYIYYARYLLSHSRRDEARVILHSALELSPTDLNARELLKETEARDAEAQTKMGDALLREGKIGEAITHYEAALEVTPDSTSTLNNLAWALSTSPDASQRNGAKALELAEKADQLAGGKIPIFVRTLAAAYAENGRFKDAIETAQRASQLALAQENSVLAKKLDKDVGRYRNNFPLHRVDQKKNGRE